MGYKDGPDIVSARHRFQGRTYFMKILRIVLPLILLAGCAASADTGPVTPAPALWKLSDPDTTIYLFGSVHALPADVNWLTPVLEQAVGSAETLVLEVDTREAERNAPSLFAAMGQAIGLPPLNARIDPELRPVLTEVIAKSGIAPQALDMMESWAAALTIAAAQLRAAGASTGAGVEQALATRFAEAGKPVIGLETTAEQLGFFDALPEDAQTRFLEQVIRDAAKGSDDFPAMAAAWAAGDLDGIEDSLEAEMRLSPELIDSLLEARNRRWAQWIEKRLAVPGTTFVAVGAGHFAGKDSLPELLEARALNITRVQ